MFISVSIKDPWPVGIPLFQGNTWITPRGCSEVYVNPMATCNGQAEVSRLQVLLVRAQGRSGRFEANLPLSWIGQGHEEDHQLFKGS